MRRGGKTENAWRAALPTKTPTICPTMPPIAAPASATSGM